MTSARITLYVRDGCHLCQEALAVAIRVAEEMHTTVVTVDVDSDDELRRQYNDQVPVTLVDGRPHDFWRVDPDRLRAALSRGVDGLG